MKIILKGLPKEQIKIARDLIKNDFICCNDVHDCESCPFHNIDCEVLEACKAKIKDNKIIIKTDR